MCRVWSRNLKHEVAMARVGRQGHRKKISELWFVLYMNPCPNNNTRRFRIKYFLCISLFTTMYPLLQIFTPLHCHHNLFLSSWFFSLSFHISVKRGIVRRYEGEEWIHLARDTLLWTMLSIIKEGEFVYEWLSPSRGICSKLVNVHKLPTPNASLKEASLKRSLELLKKTDGTA